MNDATTPAAKVHAQFLRDVAAHEMTAFRDDGLYRHLRFRNSKSWAYGFDLVTWPGYLAYTGDMGCYAFARLPDMFFFFRDGRPSGEPLAINPGYWGEKVEAVDRNGPVREFSEARFRLKIKEWLDEAGASREVRRAVKEYVLSMAGEGEHRALTAAHEFEFDGFRFVDFWEADCREFGSRFLWCCHALPWAIRLYDRIAGGARNSEDRPAESDRDIPAIR
jgi:hypothetical protein